MSDALQKKTQRLIRKLGRLIQAEADKGMSKPGANTVAEDQANSPLWVSAFVDVRWFGDAEGGTAKLRVVLPNGNMNGIHTTKDMKNLFREIWSVREEDESADWYGLKVMVSNDGNITTEFNHDPKCVSEKAFFLS